MTNESIQAAERLIRDNFLSLLPIARREGITIKRMAHLLIHTLTVALDQDESNRFEMMADSGYSRRGIRLLLAEDSDKHSDGTLGRFMNQWAEDAKFPDELPIEARRGPSFDRLHQRYGRDFTRPGLLKVLRKRGMIEVSGDKVRVLRRVVTSQTPPRQLENGRQAMLSLLHTIAHNLSGQAPKLLQKQLGSRAIPSAEIPAVREKIQAALKAAEAEVNTLLAAYGQPKKRAAKDEPETEIGIGVFCYEIADPDTVFNRPTPVPVARRKRRAKKAAAPAKPAAQKTRGSRTKAA